MKTEHRIPRSHGDWLITQDGPRYTAELTFAEAPTVRLDFTHEDGTATVHEVSVKARDGERIEPATLRDLARSLPALVTTAMANTWVGLVAVETPAEGKPSPPEASRALMSAMEARADKPDHVELGRVLVNMRGPRTSVPVEDVIEFLAARPGEDPVAGVMERFGVSRSTAYRYVRAAREGR